MLAFIAEFNDAFENVKKLPATGLPRTRSEKEIGIRLVVKEFEYFTVMEVDNNLAARRKKDENLIDFMMNL